MLPAEISFPLQSEADERIKRQAELVAQFPLYSGACEPIVVDLSEGEMLFIPKDWYHAVKNMSPLTISVNQFVSTPLDFLTRGVARSIGIALHGLGLFKPNNCVCHAKNKIS